MRAQRYTRGCARSLCALSSREEEEVVAKTYLNT